jgi:hypothetical protein
LSATFRTGLPLPVLIELSVAWFAPWLWLILRRRQVRQPAGAMCTALGVCLFLLYLPFFNLDSLDMGFRLFITGLPLVWIVLSASFFDGRVSGSLEPSPGGGVSGGRRRAGLVLAGLVVAGGLAVSTMAYEPRRDPPYAAYARLFGKFTLPDDSLLVCHQGLSLFYTYTTGREALNWQPEYAVPRRLLWRLSAYVPFALLSRTVPEALADGSLRELEDPYHLVREDVWQRFMSLLPEEQAAVFRDWHNPYQVRPAFLAVHQAHLEGCAAPLDGSTDHAPSANGH